jgi:EF-P beta-lysylation protein EpmB
VRAFLELPTGIAESTSDFRSVGYVGKMQILTSKPDFVLSDSAANSNLLPGPASHWQAELKRAIRDLPELLSRLNLWGFFNKNSPNEGIRALDRFPVFVPQPYLNRIEPGNFFDPLLRQVLPTFEEDRVTNGYSHDPLMEVQAKRERGLLHKYNGRVLLIVTGACAIHCRYCFRRYFPYEEAPKSIVQWSASLQQIAEDQSLDEVILSGGDPLMLVDETLQPLVQQLETIPHLRRLRIHTRLPIMIPQRVTERLTHILRASRLQTIVVIHSNHANELDEDVKNALGQLADAGAVLLNQSVLLSGVNDNFEALKRLSLRLLDCRVLPYYLHKNDPVSGTAHFEVSVERGLELIEQLRANLPGYAVPRFVQEIAGEPSKVVLG